MPGTVTLSATRAGAPSGCGVGLSLARRFLVHLGRQVEYGQIVIKTPSGEAIHCVGPRPGPSARLNLNRWRAVRRLLLGGDIAFAESYMDGDWSTPHLPALIELAARNHKTMMPSLNGTRLARLTNRLLHLRRS